MTAIHYFIETDENLNQKNVGHSNSANGPRALTLFADKRYGKGNWKLKQPSFCKQAYVLAADGRCLSISPWADCTIDY